VVRNWSLEFPSIYRPRSSGGGTPMTPMRRGSSLRVLISPSGVFISIAVAVAMSVWRAREAKTAATYGSARWATPTEILAAGLTAPDGVVLGRLARDYLRHDGPEHVLCFAPCGTHPRVRAAIHKAAARSKA
jgi:hypothetical protein